MSRQRRDGRVHSGHGTKSVDTLLHYTIFGAVQDAEEVINFLLIEDQLPRVLCLASERLQLPLNRPRMISELQIGTRHH